MQAENCLSYAVRFFPSPPIVLIQFNIIEVFQLMECKSALADQFANYEIFKVILKRSASNPEGSVGVILSSAASGDQFISVSVRVICLQWLENRLTALRWFKNI